MPVGLLTQDEKTQGWRLLNLIDALRIHKEPLEIEDIQQLGLIANSDSDLHDACSALRSGCKLATAVSIFT